MRFQVISFFFLLAFLNLIMAQGSYDDCCLKYSKEMKTKVKNMVVRYRTQGIGGGCNIPATVFTLRKGRELCGNPRDRWVQQLMQWLDRMPRYCNKRFHQRVPKRCWGHSL
ncbi:hypothetical protein CRUP_000038 [Coryphaenoides rupestris]|nr:hypothetical protein CRUP_000038 [Coryphaenoides rupestris]